MIMVGGCCRRWCLRGEVGVVMKIDDQTPFSGGDGGDGGGDGGG